MDQTDVQRIYRVKEEMDNHSITSTEGVTTALSDGHHKFTSATIAGWSSGDTKDVDSVITWLKGYKDKDAAAIADDLLEAITTDDYEPSDADEERATAAADSLKLYASLLEQQKAQDDASGITEAAAKANASSANGAAAATSAPISSAGHVGATLCNNGIIDFASFAETLAFSKALKYGLNQNAQKTIHQYIVDFMAKFYHQLYYIPTLKDDMVMVVKPETLFIYAPSCNVILPTMKATISYSRQFKAEPTRLLQVTNPVMMADGAAARNNAAQALVCLAYVDQDNDSTDYKVARTPDGLLNHHYEIMSRAKADASGKQLLHLKSDHALLDLTSYETENGIRLSMSDKGADLWLYMAKGNWSGTATAAKTTTATAAGVGAVDASGFTGNTQQCIDMVSQYNTYFEAAASKYGVSVYVLRAICAQESGGQTPNPHYDKYGNVESDGLMQIHFASHPERDSSVALDPEQCIDWGAEIFAGYLKYFDNDYYKTIWAYNQGNGTVSDKIDAYPKDWDQHFTSGDPQYYANVSKFLTGEGAKGATTTSSSSQTSTHGTLQLTTAAKTGAGETLARLSRYELARARFTSRTGTCQLYFNPYLVPGFPFVSIEPTTENSGLTIFGYITDITHSFTSSGWQTQFSFNCGRTENEATPASFPIVESEYTKDIADTYRDMLGDHIKSVTPDSIDSITAAYCTESKTVGQALAHVWREITPIQDHLDEICDGAYIVDVPITKNDKTYHYWKFKNGEKDRATDPWFFDPTVQAGLEKYVQAIKDGYAFSNDDVR